MAAGEILLISDDEEIAHDIKACLARGALSSVTVAKSGQAGLEASEHKIFDVLIVKFGLFDLDNVTMIRELRKIDAHCMLIPFIQVPSAENIDELLKLGVYDFISAPIDPTRLYFIVKKGVELRAQLYAHEKSSRGLKEHNEHLEKQNVILGKRIEESTKNLSHLYEDLRSTYMRTIKALAQAIDARDHYTHSHSEHVAKYAVAVAEEMGLSANEIEMIREACELHDLGKIGIEDRILSKPAQLTAEEWEQIKRHPVVGAHILAPLSFLKEVIELVRQHHEHFDGSGYTEGRHGENILLGARILHLADAYESMRSCRPYRKVPLSKEEAIAEIKKNANAQFDPRVVDAFLKIVDSI